MFLVGTFLLGLVGTIAAISFIAFLVSIFASLYLQHFGNIMSEEKSQKWSRANIKANFVKTLFWQWTIYVFAASAFTYLILSLLGNLL